MGARQRRKRRWCAPLCSQSQREVRAPSQGNRSRLLRRRRRRCSRCVFGATAAAFDRCFQRWPSLTTRRWRIRIRRVLLPRRPHGRLCGLQGCRPARHCRQTCLRTLQSARRRSRRRAGSHTAGSVVLVVVLTVLLLLLLLLVLARRWWSWWLVVDLLLDHLQPRAARFCAPVALVPRAMPFVLSPRHVARWRADKRLRA
mmetsp:Transcript_11289/g.29900  ORF Transcript_11289/g.29900 Transcript_11289/m.29900 type:complete len:200 (+) Transcript_11289:874-1473(+)